MSLGSSVRSPAPPPSATRATRKSGSQCLWDADGMHGAGPSTSQLGLLPRHPGGLPRARVLAGVGAAVVGLPVVTGALVSLRGDLARESVLLVYMLVVVVVAVTGGIVPALLAAAGAFLLANYFLTPP